MKTELGENWIPSFMDICKVYQPMICSTVVYIHLRVVTTMFGMSAWWHSIFFRQWYCHLEGNSIVTYILAIPSYSHNVWSHPTRHTQLTSFSLPAVCISWLVWAAALPMNWRGGKCDAWVCARLTHPTPPIPSTQFYRSWMQKYGTLQQVLFSWIALYSSTWKHKVHSTTGLILS